MNRNLNTRLAAKPEELLVAEAQQGNPAALNELYQRYLHALAGLCVQMTGDANVVEDLLQDVYLQAYRSISSLSDRASFQAFVYEVASNVVQDYLRKKQASERGTDEAAAILRSYADAKMRQEPGPEMNVVINSAMRLLPWRERQVLVLHDFQDLTFPEIAEILKFSTGTVRAIAFRARHDYENFCKPDQRTSQAPRQSSPQETQLLWPNVNGSLHDTIV